MQRIRALLALVLAAVVVIGTSPISAAAQPAVKATGTVLATAQSQAATTCANIASWGSGVKRSDLMTAKKLRQVRVGMHSNCDRIVFDIKGNASVGYHVSYIKRVRADGSGKHIRLTGLVPLQVVVRAPVPNSTSWDTGDTLYAKNRLAVRKIRYAGSFEGQTTFAVGVRAKLPFRVSVTKSGPAHGRITHVTVDIAHRWPSS